MLKRRDRIERLNEAIVESEQRITEQVLRILAAQAAGQNTATARRVLTTMEGILVEYHRSRKLLVEAGRLKGSQSAP